MKLLIITLDPTDGAAIVRVDPFYELLKNKIISELRVKIKASFEDIAWCDVLYIHRAIYHEHILQAIDAKRLGKKLWIDVDDHLLDVAVDNPVYALYQTEAVRNSIITSCRLADVLTVSSPYLIEDFSAFNKNCLVVECAYGRSIFSLKKALIKHRAKSITWRGSNTHTKSLMEFADAIVAAENNHEGWDWSFIGANPWWITERFKNSKVFVSEFMQPSVYLNFMAEKQPLVHFVALTDNKFTRCRSNSAYFDATIGNAVCIAKDWDHWKKPGIITYKDKNDFAHKFNEVLDHFDKDKDYDQNVVDAENYLLNNCTADIANRKRISILNELRTH